MPTEYLSVKSKEGLAIPLLAATIIFVVVFFTLCRAADRQELADKTQTTQAQQVEQEAQSLYDAAKPRGDHS
ncbi:hypothetical protein LVY74_16665 [Acinetobacter sp. ME22]|uniref:hypothetical protein n=1 Tax=Acinetobacter sp. ME22 TaxID=2904802 RepID=UPI001EDAF3B9|nr:hypothetical protein [Acinetobacter sp. ME22]MCG2575171.1 hypothetical protein [Acinetobacter sp. ME22]